MKKNIAIFDFDKTITKKDSFNDFLIYSFGEKKFIMTILKNSFNILLYKMNLISNANIKSKLFKEYFKNKKYSYYVELCNRYVNNRLDLIIRDDIKEIIDDYKKNNFDLVILSASFKEWIEPWAIKMGFTKVISSKFEYKKDLIEGTILEKNSCYGKNKRVLLKENFPQYSTIYKEIIAFGDSKNDQYFMQKADTKYLVKKHGIELINDYAIVTDGLWRKSLSAVRSLGKKGINVYVTGDTYLSTGMWSRYCNKKIKLPLINDKLYDEKFIECLKNTPDKPVIFPMEESTIKSCSNNYDKIKEYCYILIPSKKNLNIALNKSDTIKAAQNIGIPCPKTFFPKNATELEKIIEKEKMDDYVIKPHRGSGSSGLLYGSQSRDIDLKKHWQIHGDLILQERISSDGEGVGVSLLFDKEHEPVAFFAHKRIEQYPNSGGPSTQRIGIKDQKLVDLSIKLLKSLNWVGVAMVEWKYNSLTNEYVLMEINPRFWGSLELAVRSGVDFPYLYYQVAKNRYVKKVTDYKTDYNCRWLLPGDILRYLTKKNGREKLADFLKGILKTSEEWDKTDKRGFFASIWCQGLLVLNPKYWKYIRK